MPPNRFDPQIHHRHSIRLPDYDYAEARLYFVTLCAQNRQSIFGAIASGQMTLSDSGRIVQETWHDLPNHHAVALDEFVVMPNHVHGLIALQEHDRSRALGGVVDHAPTQGVDHAPTQHVPTQSIDHASTRLVAPRANSLGSIIGAFKAACSRKINQLRGISSETVWQRNYYERVIRSEDELARARTYIINNPLKWDLDAENPLHGKQG